MHSSSTQVKMLEPKSACFYRFVVFEMAILKYKNPHTFSQFLCFNCFVFTKCVLFIAAYNTLYRRCTLHTKHWSYFNWFNHCVHVLNVMWSGVCCCIIILIHKVSGLKRNNINFMCSSNSSHSTRCITPQYGLYTFDDVTVFETIPSNRSTIASIGRKLWP